MTRSEEVGLIQATLSNLEHTLLAAGEKPVVTHAVLEAMGSETDAADTFEWLDDALREARARALRLKARADRVTGPAPRSGPRP